jgi:hypothetical protein
MTFWEIREPSGSDYKHVHVSGKLDHPYRLPRLECERCGALVSSYYDVVLPFECPSSFRENRLLDGENAAVSLKDFKKFVDRIAVELPTGAAPRLKPQACLQPAFLDVPSIPKDDFLWSDLWSGLSSMVVADRVRQAIEHLAPVGVEFCPVRFRRVGHASPEAEPRIPASGEPEDMMQESKAGNPGPSMPPYYQLLVSAEAEFPPGTEHGQVCELCGDETAPNWRAKDAAWKNLSRDLVGSLSKGLDLFRIPERGMVFVSDRVKAVVERLRATNVCFSPFPPEAAAARKAPSSLR